MKETGEIKNEKFRIIAGFLLLIILVAFFFVLGLVSGSVAIAPGQILKILFGTESEEVARTILLTIRLPRVIAALVLGGALAVSGFLLQTFFSNPIAGPFVLGISSGAKLTVALAMIFFLQRGVMLGSWAMALTAFIGSMLSMGFVLLIAGKVKSMSFLVVCGVMTGYLCSAVTDFIVTFAEDSDIVNLHGWSLGSFSGISRGNVHVICIIVSVCLLTSFMLSKPMDAWRLGEDYAKNLGVGIPLFRAALIILSSLLSAVVTAFAGPVSFVGIAVPHLMRSLLKTAKPILMLPASFLGGAAFCLFSDLIARKLFAPAEISISSVTSLIGAPIVIYLMVSRGRTKGAENG
ncbi:MAG: iron ABC transporter permease [Lachnospiraceae bacterium]|nr:iron ABC transporter permease [Lachnospiraceae bacterium]